MPEVVFCYLMAMVKLDRDARAQEISEVAGYSSTGFQGVFQPMERRGWVVRPLVNRYMITERGKIALAIEVGRRARGMKSPTRWSFERGSAS
jgi:hypothetical protein